MYKCKGSGLEVYEDVAELIDKGITNIWEYQGKYYICVAVDDQYDNRIWIVDKETNKISDMYFTEFMLFMEDKATPVNPEVLKRVS